MRPSKTATQDRKRRAGVFKALGHPARLQIVEEVASGERCVCELVELVGLGWSAVSRHLAVLKKAGVLEDEKRGLQVFYRLADEAAKALGLAYEIEKVTELDRIMGFGVMFTPALVVDGVVKVAGKVPSLDDTKKLLV